MAASDYQWQIFPVEDFARLSDQWDSLNSMLGRVPVLSSQFVSAVLRHFGSTDYRLAILPSTDDAPLAAAIITSAGLGRWTTVQHSQAPMGFWLSRRGLEMADLIDSLNQKLGFVSLVGSLTQLDPEIHPVPEGRSMRIDSYIETASLPVQGTWAEFWDNRSKNLRQNHRKARNRANRSELELVFSEITSPHDMAEAVGQYGDIESRSWKAELGTSISRGNPQGAFYADLMKSFAGDGNAFVYTLAIDGAPIAMDLCICSEGCLVVLKTTFDAQYKELSPASLLREFYFEKIFTSKRVDRIEFYGPAMDWHKKLTQELRRMYQITWFRFSLLQNLRRNK